MVNILSAELQNANTKEVMKMLETSTHNLYNLVTELLDFAKLELDVMKVEYKVVQLPKLFNELQAEYKLQAERKGIKLQIDYSNLRLTHPAGVYWMPEVRLRQVLTNLLSNAIKYTQKGRVTLKVGVVPFTKNTSNNLADTPQKHISALPLPKVLENNYQIGEQVVLEFRVIDTGIGLAEENLEKVFEPFFKLDSPKINKTKKLESGHEKGTGLGLAIVKEMAFRLGGKVYAENNPKKGTTFVFVLPVLPLFMNQLSPEELETQAIVAKTNGKSALYQNKYHDTHNKNTLNILLAEDDCINNLYLVTLLQKSGYAVTAVSNGIDAVEAFVRERFDLVFMDGNMPGYSGIEATQAIRKD
jgi:signal transduction histidine kinase